MKICLSILFLFISLAAHSQTAVELTRKGFEPNPIVRTIPQMTNEKFIEGTQLWAQEFSRGEADISEVTGNSMTIDAFRDNAFFYRSLGDTFYHKVKYQIKISKEGSQYVLSFQITEIYTKRTLLKSGITDYLTPEGKPKDGFQDVKPSVEKTANIILDSYHRYITNFSRS